MRQRHGLGLDGLQEHRHEAAFPLVSGPDVRMGCTSNGGLKRKWCLLVHCQLAR